MAVLLKDINRRSTLGLVAVAFLFILLLRTLIELPNFFSRPAPEPCVPSSSTSQSLSNSFQVDDSGNRNGKCSYVGGLGCYYEPPDLEEKAAAYNPRDSKDKDRIKCLLTLKDQVMEIIGPHIRGKQAILLDQVYHWNLGDSFIEYGEQLLLKDLNTPVNIPCTLSSEFAACNATRIRKAIKDDPRDSILLIHGGGNFGDLYMDHRKLFNFYVSRFPNVPVLSMPQSIFYENRTLAKIDAKIRRTHPNLTLLARDFPSLAKMRVYFPAHTSKLSVDGAHYIGPVNRSICKPSVDVVFLTRKDKESVTGFGSPTVAAAKLVEAGLSYIMYDWYDFRMVMKKRGLRLPNGSLKYAKFRTELGQLMLCEGRMVITDRLHAMIMSTLMGIPHVFLDNTYGKIENYRSAVFQPIPYCSNRNLRAFKGEDWMHAVHIAKGVLRSGILP